MNKRPIHPDFQFYLDLKEQGLIDLYCDVRSFVLEIDPNAYELLYNTHALTSVYSTSEKLSDAYCMLPIYTNHLNLGFSLGTLLNDPGKLLQGTGKLIRHIPVKREEDYRNKAARSLLLEALTLSEDGMAERSIGDTISKIKMNN